MSVRQKLIEFFEDHPNKKFSIPQLKNELDTDDKKYDRSNLHKSIKGLVEQQLLNEIKGEKKRASLFFLEESPQITTQSPQITTQSPQITTQSPQITTNLQAQLEKEKEELQFLISDAKKQAKKAAEITVKPKRSKPKPKVDYWEILDLYPTKDDILTEIETKDTPTKRDAKAKINYQGKRKYREINNERGKRFIEYTTTIGREIFNKKLKALLKIKE